MIRHGDTLVDSNEIFVRSLKEQTPYPFNLTDEQVCRIIYFFGGRKLSSKGAKITGGVSGETKGHATPNSGNARSMGERFSAIELMALKDFFVWFSFSHGNNREFLSAYTAFVAKFKNILDFLRKKPAYVTWSIYMALETAGYKRNLSQLVTVVDAEGKKRVRVVEASQKNQLAPLSQMDALLWDIQNIALDKMHMILLSISPKDVMHSTLGNKSKAIRDIYSMIHMARQANRNPNMTLMQINIQGADPREKLKAYGSYVTKNRE